MNISFFLRFSLSTTFKYFSTYSIDWAPPSNKCKLVLMGSMKPTRSSSRCSSLLYFCTYLQKKAYRWSRFFHFGLKVVHSTIITNVNSHHEDLNNRSGEPLLWFNQRQKIICIDYQGFFMMEKVRWLVDVKCFVRLAQEPITQMGTRLWKTDKIDTTKHVCFSLYHIPTSTNIGWFLQLT